MRLQQKDRTEISKLRTLLANFGNRIYEPMDWSKIRALKFVEQLERYLQLRKQVADFKCIKCPEFVKHVSMMFYS